MQYQEFLDYIYERYSGNVKLGLERIIDVLTAMGNPQNKLRGIHIAGTNGKGSAAATCEALALAHGQHTGLNTSPHLIDYCERFRINGNNVNFEKILELFHSYEDIFAKYDASFFEITTAIAFQLFAESNIQTSIIEVGLGGRLDATNLFVPDVSVITTIGLDHVKTLGNTLSKIAFEKAGIIKPKVPLVLGRIPSEPMQVILNQATAQNVNTYILGDSFRTANIEMDLNGITYDYSFGKYKFPGLKINLIGNHQADNTAVALTAFILYQQSRGYDISEEYIRNAMNNIHWMGRMQIVRNRPLVIVDGAHNVQGMFRLIENLKSTFPQRKLHFLVSILADKNYRQMLKLVCEIACKIYVAKNSSDRAAEVESQVKVILPYNVEYATAGSVSETYRYALSELTEDDILICAGSLYTVAEVLLAEKKAAFL